MSDLFWNIQPYDQLTRDQLFDVLQLRVDVFVVEQRCVYREIDEYDAYPQTRHLMGHNRSGHLVAYARLLPPGLRCRQANLGRLAVQADHRKQGIGHQLLQTALEEASRDWPGHAIKISAQDYLQKFYERYGFTRTSDVYLEDGIPHVEMVKEPE